MHLLKHTNFALVPKTSDDTILEMQSCPLEHVDGVDREYLTTGIYAVLYSRHQNESCNKVYHTVDGTWP